MNTYFNYKKFKKELKEKGHKVYKKGRYITIEPYFKSRFKTNYEIIDGYEMCLDFVKWDHFNDLIYEIKFKIKEEVLV